MALRATKPDEDAGWQMWGRASALQAGFVRPELYVFRGARLQGSGNVNFCNQAPGRWEWAVGIFAAALFWLTGCGYVGDPLPPALKRPTRVEDLSAVEHGSKIVIRFTVPKFTTENLPIKERDNEDVELRIGPPDNPFNLETWRRTADRVPVSTKTSPAEVEVSAAKWYGRTVDIAVNVHGPNGNSVGWSAFVILPVVPALPVAEGIVATDAPDAVHLEWHAAAPEFRVFRKLTDEVNWTQIGMSDKPSYTDTMIDYGKSYQYYVQSIEKTGDKYAESDVSAVIGFKPTDKFPPSVPTGLTAVPGARSIELVWDRNTEKDFASYKIYRDGKLIAMDVTATAYSDRDTKPGVRYEYQVTAVDNAGNESAKSPVAAGIIP